MPLFSPEMFNPFSTNVPLLYPPQTSENLRFSDVFRGYRSGTLVENGLKRVKKVQERCLRLLLNEKTKNYLQLLEIFNTSAMTFKKLRVLGIETMD